MPFTYLGAEERSDEVERPGDMVILMVNRSFSHLITRRRRERRP